MPAWVPLAAAALPAAIDVGKALFGKKDRNPADESRKTLANMLMQNVQTPTMQQPGTQSALALLDRTMQQRRGHEEASRFRRGATGTEAEIAHNAAGDRSYSDALLGIMQQAHQQQNVGLSMALRGQQMLDDDYWRHQARKQQKDAQFASMFHSAGKALATTPD